MRKVEVTKYNENWIVLFQEEARKLTEIFGTELLEIHHFGSTSVKGLKAKPIIDMLLVVKDIQLVNKFNGEMRSLGYVPKGENGIPERRYFQKGGDQRTHHVHIYEKDNKQIIRHLAFRDYLREHPDAVKMYGDLKMELAKRFPFNIDSYIDGKESLVLELEKKALKWWMSTHSY
ncbi:GrpB family protein [Heyndrickxia sp. FSL W8-0496]|uniref:GrpB family protein n=1 Tax=Heyndrickxia TaxID=2837504 RepID=UPI0030FABCF9